MEYFLIASLAINFIFPLKCHSNSALIMNSILFVCRNGRLRWKWEGKQLFAEQTWLFCPFFMLHGIFQIIWGRSRNPWLWLPVSPRSYHTVVQDHEESVFHPVHLTRGFYTLKPQCSHVVMVLTHFQKSFISRALPGRAAQATPLLPYIPALQLLIFS